MRQALAFVLLGCGAVASAQDIVTALVRGPVGVTGRNPLPTDPVMEALIQGRWKAPEEGGEWRRIQAKDGWFEGRELGGGYVLATVNLDADETMLLDAAGHSMVYVNGVPRAGDPYAWGWLTLPVRLQKGRNELLFQVGRGRLKASLRKVGKPVELDVRDATLPDALPTDRKPLLGAIVVRNTGPKPLTDLSINGRRLPSIPAESIRKVAIDIPLPKGEGETYEVPLELRRGRQTLDRASVTVRRRKTTQTFKRTFESQIDGSVQYFAVNPAQRPGPSNHLVLSVHGASVEATSQADAYGPKDDVTIVCPTNRRPFGFDWEDWGRTDALEVLEIAKKTIPHDPLSVHLTGHSMGGHGTWALGTLFPDQFASIAPCAGWISFWSYAGGWDPKTPNPAQAMVRRSLNVYDTLARLRNSLTQGIFIWHGDADDNVPVEQARQMKAELTKIGHPDLGYGEKPGGSHWFSNESVDYAPIFDMVRRRRLAKDPAQIDFTTPNPVISSRAWWARIVDQVSPLQMSRIQLKRQGGPIGIQGTTENVSALSLEIPREMGLVQLDGQVVRVAADKDGWVHLTKTAEKWADAKSTTPRRPFKETMRNRYALVVGTEGSAEETAWAANKARYDAETWYVRGNGAVDIVTDRDAPRGRDLVVYGNASTNRAWDRALSRYEVRVQGGIAVAHDRPLGPGVGVLLSGTEGGRAVAAVGGTDLEGMRRTDRMPYFTAGIGYPDWTLFDSRGFLGAGFVGGERGWR